MNGLDEFSYLMDLARKYRDVLNRDDFAAILQADTDARLRELSVAYQEIDRRQDDIRISEWMNQRPQQGGDEESEIEFRWEVSRLFLAFDYLAAKNIPPFSSRRVFLTERIKKPNWDNLPSELQYLIDVAEAHAAHSTEEQMLHFLDHATERDMEILARTAERIRINGHFNTINDWIDHFDMVEHHEAWMVYSLLGLLDHAGLKFES